MPASSLSSNIILGASEMCEVTGTYQGTPAPLPPGSVSWSLPPGQTVLALTPQGDNKKMLVTSVNSGSVDLVATIGGLTFTFTFTVVVADALVGTVTPIS